MIVSYDTIEKWDGLIVTYNTDVGNRGILEYPWYK